MALIILVGVLRRVGLKQAFVPKRTVNLPLRNFFLLGKTVRENSCLLVEEIQHAIVHALMAYPQFIDSIAEKVCLWTAQLMPEFSETFDFDDALVLHFCDQTIEPNQQWAYSIALTKKTTVVSGMVSCSFLNLLDTIAILR